MARKTIPCTIAGCPYLQHLRGWCRRHHYRYLTYGDPCAGGSFRNTEHTDTCTLPGCTLPYLAMGLCGMHYQRRMLHGDPFYTPTLAKDQPCTVRGCVQLQAAKGLCPKHYQRHLIHGDTSVTFRSDQYGKGSITYKGYRILSKPGHPNASKHGKISEHRWIMANMLGRPLLATEVVHHLNGNRLDNRPENLELWVKTQPCGQRIEDLVAWAREIITQYGKLVDDASLQESDADSRGA